jgi:hypothetical protein
MNQLPNGSVCLDHSNFGFEFCLLFVFWCLKFSQFNQPNYLKNTSLFFKILVGHYTSAAVRHPD